VRRRFFINFLLGLAFVVFGLIPQMLLRPGDPDSDHIILRGLLPLVSSGNLFDALLALLFEILALMLLVHRVFWPLLSRILFRVQDIDTKGRRGLLVTVGIGLMGWSGVQLPKLMKDLVNGFGNKAQPGALADMVASSAA
jgi:hypothetical protein